MGFWIITVSYSGNCVILAAREIIQIKTIHILIGGGAGELLSGYQKWLDPGEIGLAALGSAISGAIGGRLPITKVNWTTAMLNGVKAGGAGGVANAAVNIAETKFNGSPITADLVVESAIGIASGALGGAFGNRLGLDGALNGVRNRGGRLGAWR